MPAARGGGYASPRRARRSTQSVSANPSDNRDEYKRVEDPARDLCFGTKVQIYRTSRIWQPGWTVVLMNRATREVMFRRAETRTRINLGYDSIKRNVRIVEYPPQQLQQQTTADASQSAVPAPIPQSESRPAAAASSALPPEIPVALDGRLDRRRSGYRRRDVEGRTAASGRTATATSVVAGYVVDAAEAAAEAVGEAAGAAVAAEEGDGEAGVGDDASQPLSPEPS